MKLGMFLRQFDPTLLPSLIAGNIRNRDGSGTWPFFVESSRRWNKRRIRRLLNQHEINSWGWGSTIKNEWMFTVCISQAIDAEILMKQAGVTVKGRHLTVEVPR